MSECFPTQKQVFRPDRPVSTVFEQLSCLDRTVRDFPEEDRPFGHQTGSRWKISKLVKTALMWTQTHLTTVCGPWLGIVWKGPLPLTQCFGFLTPCMSLGQAASLKRKERCELGLAAYRLYARHPPPMRPRMVCHRSVPSPPVGSARTTEEAVAATNHTPRRHS